MDEMKNKIAIVTGGARGIGFGICEALGAAGCDLMIADIDEERSRAAVATLLRAGYRCETQNVDVSREDSVHGMVQSALKRYGRIDILVNCSGVAPNVVSTIQLTFAEWNRVLSVNLSGLFV